MHFLKIISILNFQPNVKEFLISNSFPFDFVCSCPTAAVTTMNNRNFPFIQDGNKESGRRDKSRYEIKLRL